jgi:hypothetical protein
MSAYQEKLRELTQDEVVSQLEGDDGLLALTRAELFYIGEAGVQRAPLGEIKKVVGGKGGTLVVMGEAAPLIEAPVRAFQVDELRLFFESVKTFVARQKQATSSVPPPEPAPPPAPEPAPEPEPEAAPEERPVTLEEELPPPITPPEEPAPAAAEIYATEPAATGARRTGGFMGALLKLFSLGTLGAAGYWVYMNPTADLTNLIFVGVLGLGVALVEWHASNL